MLFSILTFFVLFDKIVSHFRFGIRTRWNKYSRFNLIEFFQTDAFVIPGPDMVQKNRNDPKSNFESISNGPTCANGTPINLQRPDYFYDFGSLIV